MAFTTKDVATPRERTGCGIMGYKKALTEPNGDMDAAVDILREKGLAVTDKKSGRIAAEGVAYAQVNALGDVAVVAEINTEADFVAKNAKFQALVKTVADTAEKQNPADVDALLNLVASGFDKKVDGLPKEKIQAIGENIKIRRSTRMEGPVVSYVHANDQISVITQLGISAEIVAKPEFQEYAKNIAMQIAAVNPSYLNEQTVPADAVGHEEKTLTEQAINDDKLATIAEKIVAGRLSKLFKDICLVDQVYVKDSDKNVQQYTDSAAKELGGEITIETFTRFEKGESLEKKEDNFVDEVVSVAK